MKEKEEVDIESVCDSEVNKLMGYTAFMLEEWEIKNPIKVGDRKQQFFTPKMPYFQNL
jgi:hypothetical protein